MTRRADWPERLAAFLQARKRTPFAWGSNDCGLFVCDAVVAMTGEDPGKILRGQYSSFAGFVRSMQKMGRPWHLNALAEQLAAENGFAEIGREEAQRGDILLVWNYVPCRFSLAVEGFRGQPVFPGLHGALEVPREWTRRAWRVA